jgi:RNA polymerase sigma-70 factor (ECF subfamily)
MHQEFMLFSHTHNDTALLFRIAAGDRAALLLLYDRYVGILLALAQHIVGPGNEAEDVIHDVFINVWRHAAQYRPRDGTVRAWLVLQTRRTALELIVEAPEILDQVRPRGFLPSDFIQAPASFERLRHSGQSLQQERRQVQRALASLPQQERHIFEIIYFQANCPADLLEKTALPVHRVQHHLSTTFIKFQQALHRAA